jgi:hypothetical protein
VPLDSCSRILDRVELQQDHCFRHPISSVTTAAGKPLFVAASQIEKNFHIVRIRKMYTNKYFLHRKTGSAPLPALPQNVSDCTGECSFLILDVAKRLRF